MKMKLVFFTLLFSLSCFAQDISNPELDYYQEAPINEDEYSEEELIDIQESQEEVLYNEEYDEEIWQDDNQRQLQELEEDYVE